MKMKLERTFRLCNVIAVHDKQPIIFDLHLFLWPHHFSDRGYVTDQRIKCPSCCDQRNHAARNLGTSAGREYCFYGPQWTHVHGSHFWAWKSRLHELSDRIVLINELDFRDISAKEILRLEKSCGQSSLEALTWASLRPEKSLLLRFIMDTCSWFPH